MTNNEPTVHYLSDTDGSTVCLSVVDGVATLIDLWYRPAHLSRWGGDAEIECGSALEELCELIAQDDAVM